MTVKIVDLDDSHNCKAFKCSDNRLTSWLKRHARISVALNSTKVHVAIYDDAPTVVVGYYAHLVGEIRLDELPDQLPAGMSDPGPYPLPVVLLARFATDKRYEGRGIGAKMLHDLLLRAADIADRTGCVGLEVDALTEEAKGYYLSQYGEFVTLRDSLHLFLPISVIKKIAAI